MVLKPMARVKTEVPVPLKNGFETIIAQNGDNSQYPSKILSLRVLSH